VRVLVTVPHPDRRGGVIAYWQSIEASLQADIVLFTVGKRIDDPTLLRRICTLTLDYLRFLWALHRDRIDVVQLNPSLDPKSLFRDGFFLLLGRAMRKPVVVLFHGWTERTERTINRWPCVFRAVYGHAAAILVLHSRFRSVLRRWGCSQPIHTTTSVIDPQCARAIEKRSPAPPRDESHDTSTVLFMSRIMEAKGIRTAIDAVKLASARFPKLRMLVAGDGPDLAQARDYAVANGLGHVVTFLGDVRGEKKIRTFLQSSMYVLPSRHQEGMPTTVLEAMAFALPVVVTNLAGLADFLNDRHNALVLKEATPEEVCSKICQLLGDQHLAATIGETARRFALDHFTPKLVAQRLDRTYEDVLRVSGHHGQATTDRDWYAQQPT